VEGGSNMASSHLPSRHGSHDEGTDTDTNDTHSYVSISDLEHSYNLVDVDVDRGVIYVSDKNSGNGTSLKLSAPLANEDEMDAGTAVSQGEISGSGASAWRREVLTDYNPDFVGASAFDMFKEMKNDSVIRSALRIAKTPILSARWFMEPASQDPEDVYRADFIWKNLNEWMTISWPEFLTEVLNMLDYGVYTFEKVFDIRNVAGPNGTLEPMVIWTKFAPRSVYEIEEFVYDDEGGPEHILIATDEDPVELPIDKALIFTHDKEAGDLWGHSVLRSAYKHWFYKEQLYKIDAIQKERHSIGIPIIKLPPNFNPRDRTAAERIGENLRTNERAHVVLPPGWDVMFLRLEGNQVDALDSARHHAEMIYENVLANFMFNNRAANDADVQEHVFTRSVRFVAEIIRAVLNKYAIPQLIRYNWDETELENGYPQLKVRRLGDERDWRVISFAIRNLVSAGVVRPDDPTEAWIRDELDMPVADPETSRIIVADADDDDDDGETDDENTPRGHERNPSRNAGTRQSTSAGQRQAQSPGRSRGDGSGTSGTS